MKHQSTLLMVLLFAIISTGPAADRRVGVQSRGEQEYMFVMGDGQKAWYSALELEQIARTYAQTQKLDFKFEGTEKSVWVHTDGGKVLAEVWFKAGGGRPTLQVHIGRKGNVLKHKIVVAGA